MKNFTLPELPPAIELETKAVLKQAAVSHRRLAELKGISANIPNQNILINTLPLLEAKDSSTIENIITTHDEIFKEGLYGEFLSNASAKEVQNYSYALRTGFEKIKETALFANNQILEIQACIVQNRAGFRKLAGTELKNLKTGETIYVPPQDESDIIRLMKNLENYINDETMNGIDPLIKMAIIHY